MTPLEALQKLWEPVDRSEMNFRIMVQPGEKSHYYTGISLHLLFTVTLYENRKLFIVKKMVTIN